MIAQEQHFHDITVYLDGSTFLGCAFERCRFVFSGLIPSHLEGCRFTECKWEFAGPAANVIGFLTSLYSLGGGGKDLVEKTFESIRKNATGQRRPGDAITLN
jgi:hypothetical protein